MEKRANSILITILCVSVSVFIPLHMYCIYNICISTLGVSEHMARNLLYRISDDGVGCDATRGSKTDARRYSDCTCEEHHRFILYSTNPKAGIWNMRSWGNQSPSQSDIINCGDRDDDARSHLARCTTRAGHPPYQKKWEHTERENDSLMPIHSRAYYILYKWHGMAWY